MKVKGSAQDPLWYKDAVIYEAHVKAFFDSNGDGIGDFPGITEKLDYLHDLGITCLWLLPFFPSPLRDDGYDIADYCNVHPSYGTLADFQKFTNAAHERNIQVLVELVINHTSDQHPWFQAARLAPPGSRERDYYVWSNSDKKFDQARIIFTDTEKSNWAWDAEAKAYYWHRFFSHQPDLNFDNPAVMEEVLGAMRYWLDMGADGMRLDAIPYLIEREGTNCENLVETHDVIRRIRKALDERYTNRLMLAEANQWPADVLPYFGNEDECHMTFHFPLMPRIFMALRLEDRHPITEIMGQTPPIPPSCQWGLFLRNHDELTLEMVTDEERDYMYLAYSADARMRVNVGIRRRLAPLMDNNRRRIELMNSFLFSFPGTPILYYGDEIGMGDNIYLGDRNGVRTPMQWSADRNGGFSRANPARLYSPLIMDPVYGYQAVNVEAQQSDPSSLLHWMRNMIALRKLFRVFGRGTLEFLAPENRKILAYLRKYEGDQILCVANLSRYGQPVELDLSALAGMTPVEMLGFTEFPTIGKQPYRLSLGPYAFFWFELQGALEPIEVRTPAAARQGSAPALSTGREFLEGGMRPVLETVLLPQWLPKQRWFGGKSRAIQKVSCHDWVWLGEEAFPFALVFVNLDYEDGGRELYNVPLGITLGEPAVELRHARPGAVLCDLTLSSVPGILHDGLASDEMCLKFLDAVQARREVSSRLGTVRFEPSELPTTEELAESRKITRGASEQSNSSVQYGGRLILKLFRRVEDGPNPDCEITRFLTEEAGFERTPKLAASVDYVASDRALSTVAMIQHVVPNQGDGWRMTTEELARYYEHCAALKVPPPTEAGELDAAGVPSIARDHIGVYLDYALRLGRRTAELHLALGEAYGDPGFAPEPLTKAHLQQLSSGVRASAARAFQVLKAALPGLPDEFSDTAGGVLALRHRILQRLRTLEQMDVECTLIRIHGDYHLGQVLWVENDFVLIDFEGEPARPLEERRQKQLALRDVAGMLRSFSYAAYSSLLQYTTRRPEDFARLEPWALYWERWTAAMFLKGYRETADSAPFLPQQPGQFEALLECLMLDKALYELIYELNNRPDWIRIPLLGIVSMGNESATTYK